MTKETQQDFGLVECGGCAPPVLASRPRYLVDPTGKTPPKLLDVPAPLAQLPDDSAARKRIPIYSGVLSYFPDVMVALGRVSQIGNDKHNPGQPLHWSRGKSDDHRDCLMRHLMAGYTRDKEGVPEPVYVVWRAAADCQLYLERSPWV